MQIVYICSPLKAKTQNSIQSNITKANLYSRFAYEQGYLPIAPHCIFTQFLDDENPEERKAGVNFGLQLIEICNELWAFGEPSEGMKNEIEKAKKLKIKIKYFNKFMEEV